MTVADPDQGITLQVGGDPANYPSAQNAMFGGVLTRLVRHYASVADRTARMTSLNENDISTIADLDRVEVYNGANHISLHTRSLYHAVRRTTDAAVINNSTVVVLDPILRTGFDNLTGIFCWRDIIIYSSSQAGDYKVSYTWPGGGATALWGGNGLAVSAGGTTGDAQFAVTTVSGTTAPYGGAGVGVQLMLIVDGELSLAGTGGELRVGYAQQTADATNTIPAYAGSRREVWRVS